METGKLGVLIDSDALVSIMKPNDTNFNKTIHCYEFLKKQQADQYLSPLTIPEVATMLSYRVNHKTAIAFLAMTQEKRYTILDLPEKIRNLADQLFLKQTKNRTSYFDCVNLIYMDLFGFDAIFSFDKIYQQNGFKLVSDLI